MQLTDHFTLEELVRSTTAERLSIDNTPSDEISTHLMAVAMGLEQVRTLLGAPLHIDSGYRCPQLNRVVGGALDSDHVQGWAADFICPDYGNPLAICARIADSSLRFHKLIQEGSWVHISFNPLMARETLTAHFSPDGTTYTRGVA